MLFHDVERMFELLGYPEEGGNVFIRKRRRNGLLAGFFRAGFEAVPHGGFLENKLPEGGVAGSRSMRYGSGQGLPVPSERGVEVRGIGADNGRDGQMEEPPSECQVRGRKEAGGRDTVKPGAGIKLR